MCTANVIGFFIFFISCLYQGPRFDIKGSLKCPQANLILIVPNRSKKYGEGPPMGLILHKKCKKDTHYSNSSNKIHPCAPMALKWTLGPEVKLNA